MDCLVNLIHPYTYRLQGNGLIIGPMEEFCERDFMAAEFLTRALERGKVLHCRDQPERSLRGILVQTAFMGSPLYHVLADSRMKSVVIPVHGIPLPETRPEQISHDIWCQLQGIYASHRQLQQEVGQPQNVFFIGGMLENCVTSAAFYHSQFFRSHAQQLYYVPELCATRDVGDRKITEEKFQQQNIHPLTFAEALELMT